MKMQVMRPITRKACKCRNLDVDANGDGRAAVDANDIVVVVVAAVAYGGAVAGSGDNWP